LELYLSDEAYNSGINAIVATDLGSRQRPGR
jgi:hypothetical protein